MCNRFEALVASHLDPEAFGHYMAVGTQKLTQGNVIFFEIDSKMKSDFFRLHDIAERCVPHPDGAPKRSKYISIYRTLEHLDLSAIGKLYLVTADGRVMGLDAAAYDAVKEEKGPNLYQELCPVTPMVASALSPGAFTKFMTDPGSALCVPRIFFADLLLDRDATGHMEGYLPYMHPGHIVDCIKQIESGSAKSTKTVSRTPSIRAFYRTIRRGFFIGDQTGVKFYPFPSLQELEIQHSHWWRSAQAG
jgi:hypothetical protein